MLKSIFFSSIFALFSITSYANTSELVSYSAEVSNVLVDCPFSERGTLSCGMAYAICGQTRDELDELYAELDCLNCENCVDENDNPAPGN